jgi:hypothetical protein
MTPSPALSLGPAEAPPAWLADIARSIRSALDAGAVRVADPAGHLVLVRPCGRHFTAAAHIVEQLAQAGLLPPLPETLGEPGMDDPVDRAERAAIASEPPLPPEGTAAWAALDQRQAATVRGLLAASRVRPSCFEGTADCPPPMGSFCSCCAGRNWWFPRHPKTDGTGVSPHRRCASCRPAPRLSETEIVRIETR